jgi:hypothetical protein
VVVYVPPEPSPEVEEKLVEVLRELATLGRRDS